jgi:hypothetical protein
MGSRFYFMRDSFYNDFANCGLMPNKEGENGKRASRPCFFAFEDNKNKNIYWFIPISSKIDKYEAIADKNIAKYGKCDFIEFGKVLGYRKAFLIQNMFPVTKKYIESSYVSKNVPVQIDNVSAHNIISKARNVLIKKQNGINLIFTDINKIYQELEKQLKKEIEKCTNKTISTSQTFKVNATENSSLKKFVDDAMKRTSRRESIKENVMD